MKLRSLMPELDGATTWINGKITNKELVGEKPTIIHFWSVSCHMCTETIPNMMNFLNQYSDNLHVVSVHMPRSKSDTDLNRIKELAEKYGLNHPIYVDNDLILTDVFDNQYVPAYYLFDRRGILRHYQAGESGMKMLEKRINRIIEEKTNRK
nr:redoxin domain-containing protein [Lysinibacillus timonensis]